MTKCKALHFDFADALEDITSSVQFYKRETTLVIATNWCLSKTMLLNHAVQELDFARLSDGSLFHLVIEERNTELGHFIAQWRGVPFCQRRHQRQ